ncbi:MAG: nucleotidyltransferase family protein [Halorhodospira sp.]
MTSWPLNPAHALSQGLAQPEALIGFPESLWTGILAVGRENLLLGALWHRAVSRGVEGQLPEWVAGHLWGAAMTAETNAAALEWELQQLDRGALRRFTAPVVLKGGAYLLAGLPNAAGRIVADIDLLVRRTEVERAESALLYEGWAGTHHDTYDQRYYRQWMHELPPLQHRKRGTTLDLHHNILPETFAVVVDPAPVLEHAVSAPGLQWLRLPAPRHLVLHAIVHLFSETDWDRGLRDLYDIHSLLEHFGEQDGEPFWEALLDEAAAMRLLWLVEPAVWCCQRRFGTWVPASAAERLALSRPGLLGQYVVRPTFEHALNGHLSTTPKADALARALLLIRGHWLKMPPWLLARHLFYKAFLAPRDPDAEGAPMDPQQHG